MNFGLSEEQELLRKTARDFLEERAPLAFAREAIERGPARARELWVRVAELGWTGLQVPEKFGGAGLGEVELCILLEEFGRNLVPLPFLPHALATTAVLELADDAQRAHWLPKLASGAATATLSFASLDVQGEPEPVLEVEPRGDGWRLRGAVELVPDADAADLLIIPARSGAQRFAFAVPRTATGVSLEPMKALDLLRPLSRATLDGVVVAAEARLGGAADPRPGLRRLRERALLLLAAEMLGGAERCLETSVAYAKQRVQFGKPIGVHQAIKHKCADMLFAVEAARSILYYAAWAARERRDDAGLLAGMAKATAGDAYRRAAADNLQIHGGVGFTWEYDCHLFLRRARSDDAFFGSSSEQRDRIAGALDFAGGAAAHSE
jgi:alkylation response protein AidB-like acyl-CoA dehydrogenase